MAHPHDKSAENKTPGPGQAKSQIKAVIAVAAGKGGVGKSTVAVMLASSLRDLGFKVGLLDADIYGPSLALMTDAGGESQDSDGSIKPAEASGIKVISVGMFADPSKAQMLRGPMAANLVTQFYKQVAWGELDFLIIDYPPGTGDIQLSISQQMTVNAAVIVTTPQEVALLDVRKALFMFKTLNVPVCGIVENMSYYVCNKCDEKHFLLGSGGGKKLAEEYALPLLAELAIDETLSLQADQGEMASSNFKSGKRAQAILELGNRFLAEFEKFSPSQNLKSFTLNWRN